MAKKKPSIDDFVRPGADKKTYAELEKLVGEQQSRIEGLLKSRFKLPASRKTRGKSGSFIRIAIPDTHGAKVDPSAIASFLGDLESIGPEVREVVFLGDHLDCGGFLAQHHTLGYVAETAETFEDDVTAANQLLDAVQGLCPSAKLHYIEGNHECVTPEHEVLTRRGWIPIADVTTLDTVASMTDAGDTDWTNPLAVHKYHYEGDLVTMDGPAVRIEMTPSHRVWYWSQNGRDLLCRKAWRLHEGNSTYNIPCAARNQQADAAYLDDEIRLLGWILTDGTLSSGKVEIYQSKEKHLPEIRRILNSLGIRFKERIRVRTPSAGIATALPSHLFSIVGNSRVEVAGRLFGVFGKWTRADKAVPAWVNELSERQIDILVGSIVDGDGSRNGSAMCIYGALPFLEAMQALMVVNGYRVSLSKRWRKNGGNGYECLNVTKRDRGGYESRNIKRKPYAGMVHCLTTVNDNFFIRFRGRVHVTGNSRLEKWCVTQALSNQKNAELLLRAVGVEHQLNLKSRGISHYRQGRSYDGCRLPATIRLGRCFFTHGSRTGRNSAQAMLSDFGSSVVFGHIHQPCMATARSVKDGELAAWCPGCLCKLQPLWMHTQVTKWSHGYGLQFVRPDGDFLHVNVPIIEGQSYLVPLTSLLK